MNDAPSVHGFLDPVTLRATALAVGLKDEQLAGRWDVPQRRISEWTRLGRVNTTLIADLDHLAEIAATETRRLVTVAAETNRIMTYRSDIDVQDALTEATEDAQLWFASMHHVCAGRARQQATDAPVVAIDDTDGFRDLTFRVRAAALGLGQAQLSALFPNINPRSLKGWLSGAQTPGPDRVRVLGDLESAAAQHHQQLRAAAASGDSLPVAVTTAALNRLWPDANLPLATHQAIAGQIRLTSPTPLTLTTAP